MRYSRQHMTPISRQQTLFKTPDTPRHMAGVAGMHLLPIRLLLCSCMRILLLKIKHHTSTTGTARHGDVAPSSVGT
jgi:hypothetical protein